MEHVRKIQLKEGDVVKIMKHNKTDKRLHDIIDILEGQLKESVSLRRVIIKSTDLIIDSQKDIIDRLTKRVKERDEAIKWILDIDTKPRQIQNLVNVWLDSFECVVKINQNKD